MLADDILLLLTSDETGRSLVGSSTYTDLVVAGAVMVELSLAGNLRVTEPGETVRKKRVVLVPDAPWPKDPMLTQALAVANTKPKWRPHTLCHKLASKASQNVYERLIQAEILRMEEDRVLGMLPLKRWKPMNPQPRQHLLNALREPVMFGTEPQVREAALLALLSASMVIVRVLDPERRLDRRQMKKLANDLRKQYWGAQAAYYAISEYQGAAMA